MMTSAELVVKVRRLINEADNDPSISLITDDTRSLDTSIQELLPQAVALVQKNARNGMVNVKVVSPWTCNLIITSTKGYFSLPEDFVSLVSLKLTTWKTSLNRTSSPGSYEALLLNGNVKSATSSRPVCLATFTSDGKRVIEMTPATDASNVEHFLYEAQFNLDEGLNKHDSHMADAVAYACASLLYNMFERYDASKSSMTYALALCGTAEK